MEFRDVCARTSNCCIWYTYSLHEFHNAIFSSKEDKEEIISGDIAGLYADHLIIPNSSCEYCPPTEKVVDEIRKRNREDLVQMVKICRFLYR